MQKMEPVVVDNRIDFLGTFVQKTLKLKSEKWTRLMATEEYKAIVIKFLEMPAPMLLVIVLTPAAQLVATNGFPLLQLKTKGKSQVFFIRCNLSCLVAFRSIFYQESAYTSPQAKTCQNAGHGRFGLQDHRSTCIFGG